jgi:hypothetical protein
MNAYTDPPPRTTEEWSRRSMRRLAMRDTRRHADIPGERHIPGMPAA